MQFLDGRTTAMQQTLRVLIELIIIMQKLRNVSYYNNAYLFQ